MRHKFRIELPFTHGVPYLSRSEQVRAIALENTKRDVSKIPDIALRPEDIVSFAFVNKSREKIREWLRMEVCSCAKYRGWYLTLFVIAAS